MQTNVETRLVLLTVEANGEIDMVETRYGKLLDLILEWRQRNPNGAYAVVSAAAYSLHDHLQIPALQMIRLKEWAEREQETLKNSGGWAIL